jgi:ring-1,2-phenylacetyl-CoA epoxidase subunit PaaD
VVTAAPALDRAAELAGSVLDPELPQLTLADLGILRGVSADGDTIVVTITPTYSGCPAMSEIRFDVRRRLHDAGYRDVDVRLQLDPPWTTDWITAEGRRKLRTAGIAPPVGTAPRPNGPVSVTLGARSAAVPCPRCGSTETTQLSRFGATACRALHRCAACAETFDYVKPI